MILLLYEPTRSAWTNRDVWPFDNYIALIEFDASCPIAVYTEYIRIHGSNAQRRDCTHTILFSSYVCVLCNVTRSFAENVFIVLE